MLANREPRVTSLQKYCSFCTKKRIGLLPRANLYRRFLTTMIVIPKRKIMNHEFFCLDGIQNKGRKNFSNYWSISTLKELPHNFSHMIKNTSLRQPVLYFLMCISCGNEDITEFKDRPKHYADPQHHCCKLHSSEPPSCTWKTCRYSKSA